MSLLEIDHVFKSFGTTRALHDMTFDVRAGEIFGFVGSNGAARRRRCASCWGCSPPTPVRCVGTART